MNFARYFQMFKIGTSRQRMIASYPTCKEYKIIKEGTAEIQLVDLFPKYWDQNKCTFYQHNQTASTKHQKDILGLRMHGGGVIYFGQEGVGMLNCWASPLLYINKMFNFDNIAYGNYSNQYCGYSYVYAPQCYLPDNSYPYNFSENTLPVPTYYQPSFGFNYLPTYSPLELDDIKCPTQPTRDSEIQQEEEEDHQLNIPIPQPAIQIKKEDEEDEPVRFEQRYGRNIVSNIFHSIIKFASSENKFENIIQSVITSNRMTISKSQFKQKLKQKTEKLKGYVNAKTIKGLYLGKRIGATRLDLQFSRILRILSRVYLKNYHVSHIYTSSKIKRKSRPLHFKRMKVLLRMIK